MHDFLKDQASKYGTMETMSVPIPLVSEAACFVMCVQGKKCTAALGLKTNYRKGAKDKQVALWMLHDQELKFVSREHCVHLLPPVLTEIWEQKKRKDSSDDVFTQRTISKYTSADEGEKMHFVRNGPVTIPPPLEKVLKADVKLPFSVVAGKFESSDYGIAVKYCQRTDKVFLILGAQCGKAPHKLVWGNMLPGAQFTPFKVSANAIVMACAVPYSIFGANFIHVRMIIMRIRFFLFFLKQPTS